MDLIRKYKESYLKRNSIKAKPDLDTLKMNKSNFIIVKVFAFLAIPVIQENHQEYHRSVEKVLSYTLEG